MVRLAALLVAFASAAAFADEAAPGSSRPEGHAICEIAGTAVVADASGTEPASIALQRCIDLAPSPWVIPRGEYRVDASLTIRRPLKIVAPGVVWRAAPDLRGIERAHGMVYAAYRKGIELHGLTLDGNGAERRAKGPAFCDGTAAAANGVNIHLDHVDDVVLDGFTTRNAVCGSGMNMLGNDARIVRSTFRDNGTQAQPRMWADGLTLLECARCLVADNAFIDNSDVSFIFGGGRATRVADNRIVQAVPTFAALMLDNFNGTRHGDFVGTTIENNTIDCGDRQCDFGINLGPHAWYLSGYILGGTVANNMVRGAKIGIIAQGAGTAEHPVEVRGNTVSSPVPDGTRVRFMCGRRSAHTRLRSADSHLKVDDAPWTVGDHKQCP